MSSKALLQGFADELTKIAISPELAIRALKGLRGQIGRMGLPVMKGPMPVTFTSPVVMDTGAALAAGQKISPKMITTFSPAPQVTKRIPGAYTKALQMSGPMRPPRPRRVQRDMEGLMRAGLSPKEQEIMGRLMLHHEKAEAQGLLRHGMGRSTFLGHVHPSVIEREARMVRLIGKKYPAITERYQALRGMEMKGLKQISAMPQEQVAQYVKQMGGTVVPPGLTQKGLKDWTAVYQRRWGVTPAEKAKMGPMSRALFGG